MERLNPVAALAELVAHTRYEDLPPSAIAAAKTFILDTFGVGVAGSTGPKVRELCDTLDRWGRADDATLWVDGRRLPAAHAAIGNAYQVHALEFDCVHEPAVLHPMSTLLPSLMAFAEREGGVSGRDLLLATVLGAEITCTLGAASRSVMKFFRPATCGGFGVVAGLGSLARMEVPRLLDAFGILYGQTAGNMQAHVEGSMVLGLSVGFNARAGLTAIDLARAGLTGPHDVLTGPYGFYRLFEPEHDLAPHWADLGRTWQVTRLSHKPFPSGRLTHAAIDALQQAQAELGFAPEDVVSIDCAVPPLVYRLVGRPDIPAPAPNYARLCIPFVLASTLVDGSVEPETFRPERLVDARIHALAARVQVIEDANPDVNAFWPQHFVVRLAGGRTWERRIDRAIGHPDHPLTRERHLAKFRKCWALALDAARGERLISMVDRLEAIGDVTTIVGELAASPKAPRAI